MHNAQSDRSGGCGNLFDPPWGLQGGSESFPTFTNVTFRMGHEGMPPFSLQGTVCGKCHSQPLVLELFLSAHPQLGCHVVPLCRAPQGLDPFQAAKAWHLRKQEGLPWKVVRFQVHTMSGTHPGMDAVQDAVGRVEAQRRTSKFRKAGVASSGYARCGRTPLLSSEQKKAVIAFVKRWCHKRFCTANYIIQELKLCCKKKTVHRVLNDAGYHWRPVAKKGKLSEAQLKQRKAFVDVHINKTAAWWRKHMGLVLAQQRRCELQELLASTCWHGARQARCRQI